jgi:DNA recombination protein RmuC
MEIIYLFIALLIGLLFGWIIKSLIDKNKSGRLEERNNLLQEKIDKTDNELNSEREKVLKLNSDFSSLKADYDNLQRKLAEQKGEIEELQEKFIKEFENLANKIFEEKSSKFTEQNKANLDQILKPLNEKIKDFEKKVEETYDKESKERFSLAREIKGLQELNLQMSKDATNLTNALKGESKTMGNWGEVILESILEKSGLVKDREFFIQESHVSDEGKRLQPDVIVKLPENRNIIIDSKVSLVAYERYCSIEDENERAIELKSHIASIRNHINNLSAKNYQTIYELESLDFVIMFLPIEPAFSLAAQKEWALVNEATEKNIVLISPSILLIALKTIASLWRREFQNRNAFEIAKRSGALLDKFKLFVDDLISVGNNLRTTKDNYDKAMNKLVDGKGNLVSRTEKIRELGAKTTKSLPQNIIDRAIDEEGDN